MLLPRPSAASGRPAGAAWQPPASSRQPSSAQCGAPPPVSPAPASAACAPQLQGHPARQAAQPLLILQRSGVFLIPAPAGAALVHSCSIVLHHGHEDCANHLMSDRGLALPACGGSCRTTDATRQGTPHWAAEPVNSLEEALCSCIFCLCICCLRATGAGVSIAKYVLCMLHFADLTQGVSATHLHCSAVLQKGKCA